MWSLCENVGVTTFFGKALQPPKVSNSPDLHLIFGPQKMTKLALLLL